MTAADDLLRRIEAEPALAEFLTWPGDFDITRRDPVEELRLPTGLPLTPIAGDGAGGTYFLCGDPGGPRPVLYTDSEGGATLLGSDLTEAIAVIAAHSYWQDLGRGFSAEELEAEITDEDPGIPAARTEFFALLGLEPPTAEEALEHLRACAARTVPDFLPIARHEEDGASYEATYTPLLSEDRDGVA